MQDTNYFKELEQAAYEAYCIKKEASSAHDIYIYRNGRVGETAALRVSPQGQALESASNLASLNSSVASLRLEVSSLSNMAPLVERMVKWVRREMSSLNNMALLAAKMDEATELLFQCAAEMVKATVLISQCAERARTSNVGAAIVRAHAASQTTRQALSALKDWIDTDRCLDLIQTARREIGVADDYSSGAVAPPAQPTLEEAIAAVQHLRDMFDD